MLRDTRDHIDAGMPSIQNPIILFLVNPIGGNHENLPTNTRFNQ